MGVKRYSVWDDEMFEEKHALNSTNGMVHLVVKHEDYAALEQQLAAVVAENAGLKKFCKNAAFDADYEAELCMEQGGFTDAMNDITALMATMKAAAEKASNDDWVKESGDGWEATCSANDQANGGFIIAHFEGPDAAENREFVQAASPANVKTLVEALEAAEKTSAARKEAIERTHQMFQRARDRADAAEKRIAELEESHAQVIQARDHYKRMSEEGLKWLQESRTVTVKLYSAASDVLAERERQVSAEGWTPKHDDQYEHGQLAGAASCYARHVNSRGWIFPSNPESYQQEPESTNWPWTHDWWKPTNPRRDLVKAGALILAEIERIDRAAGIQVIEGEG